MANKERIARDADEIRRSKIPTIRDIQQYSNVRASEEDSVESYAVIGEDLTSLGKTWSTTPSSLIITNASEGDIAPVIDLYWNRSVAPTAMYILKNVLLPAGASIKLDSDDLAIDSKGTGLSFKSTVDSGSPLVGIRIRL